jgi:ribonuclease HI
MENSNSIVTIFTDGACSRNPGPGGWAALLSMRDRARFISGYDPHTTNNKMELLAAIAALKTLTKRAAADVYTDSRYVQDGINIWVHNWKRNNWKTSAKKPVLNRELWLELLELAEMHDVHWMWVRGHSTNRFNVFVDLLARTAIATRSGLDVSLPTKALEEFLPRETLSGESVLDVTPTIKKLEDILHGRQIPWKD